MSQQTQELIREFQLEDIPAVVAINNRVNSRVPMTVEGMRSVEEARNPEHPLMQWVVERDGRVVAYADSGIVKGTSAQDTFHVFVLVDADQAGQGIATRLLEEACAFARSHKITQLIGACSEEDPQAIAWVRKNGFEQIGHNAEAFFELDAAAVDALDPEATLTKHGLTFRTISEEKEAKGDVIPELFETLANPLIQEIVLPGGAKINLTYEQFKGMMFGTPDSDLDGEILAVRDGRYVGWCSVLMGQREAAYLNFYGTIADLRPAVEIALIQRACQIAHGKGFSRIGTHIGNVREDLLQEMHNTGFVSQPGRLIWSKQLD
ncbi:MAG TPA: GNAT family N-acetyltransferase [Bacilli bacterium]|nr:GNAT family N-acetyltransferase [Bacilli bacterium]